jgi:hypothetical protein
MSGGGKGARPKVSMAASTALAMVRALTSDPLEIVLQ